MIQRIQSVYMFLLLVINFILIISIDSDPTSSLPDSYFGYYRIYITDYFFSEIISVVILINIFKIHQIKMKNIYVLELEDIEKLWKAKAWIQKRLLKQLIIFFLLIKL